MNLLKLAMYTWTATEVYGMVEPVASSLLGKYSGKTSTETKGTAVPSRPTQAEMTTSLQERNAMSITAEDEVYLTGFRDGVALARSRK